MTIWASCSGSSPMVLIAPHIDAPTVFTLAHPSFFRRLITAGDHVRDIRWRTDGSNFVCRPG